MILRALKDLYLTLGQIEALSDNLYNISRTLLSAGVGINSQSVDDYL